MKRLHYDWCEWHKRSDHRGKTAKINDDWRWKHVYASTRVLFIIKYLGFLYDYTILDRSYVYAAF